MASTRTLRYGVQCDVWEVIFGCSYHAHDCRRGTDGQTDGGVAVENNPGLLQTTRVGRSYIVKVEPNGLSVSRAGGKTCISPK